MLPMRECNVLCQQSEACSLGLSQATLVLHACVVSACPVHGLPVRRVMAYGLQVPAAARDRLNPATSPSLAAEFEKVQRLIMHS